MSCPQHCGYDHTTTADRMACAAIHGRVPYYVSNYRMPQAMCELCGLAERFDVLLEHFAAMHGNGDPGTGRLVRYVADAPDLGRYEDA